MRLIPEKNAIVFNLKKPERVLTAIPTAKRIDHPTYNVAIPYRIDETKLLRNLGIAVPSPIHHKYTWPGMHEPFEAQKLTAAMLTVSSRAYVLNQIGTGKSLSVLWAYDYLRSLGLAGTLLVSAPLSTLERTWADEIFQNLPHLTFSVLYGSKQQRRRALDRECDVYIINHHGVEVLQNELVTNKRITHVAVDELAVLRNQRTDLWKAHNTIVNKSARKRACWGMTGTPTPNAPTDAFAQAKLVTPERAPRSFMKFRDMTMQQLGPFKWLPRKDAVETVKDMMWPAVRFTRDECIDLPDCMYESRVVPLSKEQEAAYKSMAATLVVEAEAGQILAVNEAVKASKLVQIAAGVAYDTDGKEVLINAQGRLQELHNVIESADHKVICFVPFVSTIGMVRAFLEKHGHTVGVVYGDVPKRERDVVFNSFQNADDPKVLLAQPAAMSHGLTLTTANTIVWYAPVMSNDIYEQANGRITRPGQVNKQFIVHLEGTPIESKIYRRLKEKQSMQGVLLEAVKKGREAA
jgi:SNF2 family DNA or RNA helicase